ncbi:MAG: hypothetical protein KAW16_01345 [candidate division Zixibacteria bacterium]|nr:hypothetical protein [candidate division Zixibacteria bacterium]
MNAFAYLRRAFWDGMMVKNPFILILSILFIYASPLPPLAGYPIFAAQPPVDVKVMDTPNDKGESITLIFEATREDTFEIEYELWRSSEEENSFQIVGKILFSDKKFIDTGMKDGVDQFYFLKGTGENDTLISAVFGPVVSKGQWFNSKQTNVLLAVIISFLFIFGFILYGKKRKKLYIRPMAGLEAIDDAIGRATEMGKPILYSSGLGKMDRVATMASMNILGSVAEKTAEFNTPLIFPNYDPVVMTTAQEVVKEGYSKAGHPEAYKPDDIFFVTQSQFGYAAAVDGIMTRQLPATNLFLGTFEAEALILAETGNSIGAIQIAGTDSTIQLSFFIVACDYTLIGEELFVASGYLTKDPQILGSIKGQDWLKAIIVLLILIGGIAGILGFEQFIHFFNIG